MKKLIIPALTHLFVLVFGFALGIYLLPILTAPKAPDKNFIINESNKAAVSYTHLTLPTILLV